MEVDEIVVAFGGGAGIAATITALGGMIAAVITSIVTLRKVKKVGEDAAISAHEVRNNSGSSLRDTADRTEQAVANLSEALAEVQSSQSAIQANLEKDSEMIRSQGHQLGEIRTELAAERRERQASDERHHDEHQRLWSAIK